MNDERGIFRCPICGKTTALDQEYNARRRKLTIVHIDGRTCERTDVDEWGRP